MLLDGVRNDVMVIIDRETALATTESSLLTKKELDFTRYWWSSRNVRQLASTHLLLKCGVLVDNPQFHGAACSLQKNHLAREWSDARFHAIVRLLYG